MTTDIIGDRVQLQLHLKLLKAFSSLKEKVETVYTFGSLRSSELDHATKFKIFVNMAVYRFEHWLQAMTKSQVTGQLRLEHLPPLDVLMVWHAYSLNPRWYCEDGLRLHPVLRRLDFPLHLAVANLQYDEAGAVLTRSITSAQELIWPALEMPFDPTVYLSTGYEAGRVIKCPNCEGGITSKWIGDVDGTGWVGDQCWLECGECKQWSGTRSDFGKARLLREVRQIVQEVTLDHSSSKTLAGTLTTLRNVEDIVNAKRAISQLKELSCVESVIVEDVNKPKWLNRTLSTASSATPFSIDLAGAVIRQSSFVAKMINLGFVNLADDIDGESTLDRCVYRYHAFLQLMRNDSSLFFVPTLDIDLAWHTHQLVRGAKYCQDTIEIVGRLVDHNDDVEEGPLTDSFAQTAQAWKAKFGISYAEGCDCHSGADKVTTREVHPPIVTLLESEDDAVDTHIINMEITKGLDCGSLGTRTFTNFPSTPQLKAEPDSMIDRLRLVLGSSCGGCGSGGCGGCGSGRCGGGNIMPKSQTGLSACGGCGGGGCGDGKCGGCGAGTRHTCRVEAACGGCGSGGCGSGGCGSGGCGGGD